MMDKSSGVSGPRFYRVVVDYINYDQFEFLDRKDVEVYGGEFSRRKEMGRDWPGIMQISVTVNGHYDEGEWSRWYGLDGNKYPVGLEFNDKFRDIVLAEDRETVKDMVCGFVKDVLVVDGTFCDDEVKSKFVVEGDWERRVYPVIVDYFDRFQFMNLTNKEDLEIYDEELPKLERMGQYWPGVMQIIVGVDGSDNWLSRWYGLDKDKYPNNFEFDSEFENVVLSGDRELVKAKVNELIKKAVKVEGGVLRREVRGLGIIEEENEEQQKEGIESGM